MPKPQVPKNQPAPIARIRTATSPTARRSQPLPAAHQSATCQEPVILQFLHRGRHSLLLLILSSLIVSTVAPILGDQILPGQVSVAEANFDANHKAWDATTGTLKAGRPDVTVKPTNPGGNNTTDKQYLVSLSWSAPESITSNDKKTLTTTNEKFTKTVKAGQGSTTLDYECDVNYTVSYKVIPVDKNGAPRTNDSSDSFSTSIQGTAVKDASKTGAQSDDPSSNVNLVSFSYAIETTYTARDVHPESLDCKSLLGSSPAVHITTGQTNLYKPIRPDGSAAGSTGSKSDRQPSITPDKADAKPDESTHTVDVGIYFTANPIEQPNVSPYFRLFWQPPKGKPTEAPIDTKGINFCESNGIISETLACGGQQYVKKLTYSTQKNTVYEFYVAATFKGADAVNSDLYSVTLDTKGTIIKQGTIKNSAPALNANPTTSDLESTTKCGESHGLEDYICQALAVVVKGLINLYIGFLNFINESIIKGLAGLSYLSGSLDFTDVKLSWAKTLYDISLKLVNYLIVLALLFLSFVNILHINIDTYGIKKAMPTLVLGVILSNFSFLIARLLIDAADVLSSAALNGQDPSTLLDGLMKGMLPLMGGATAGIAVIGVGAALLASPAGWLAVIAVFVISLLPTLLFLFLALLFWLRFYIVVGLVAVAPLAFVMSGIPFAEQYFKQWLGLFTKWVFMAPISFLLLFLGSEVGNSLGDNAFGKMVLTSAFVYAAIQVPFQMGGGLMTQWGGLVKKAGGWGGKKADSWLGDVTKATTGTRTNFRGFIGGVKKQAEKKDAERQIEAEGVGAATEDMRQQLVPTLWRSRSIGGTRKSLREHYATTMKDYQQAGGQEDIKNANLGADSNLTKAEHQEKLDAAIAVGSFEDARRIIMQMAGAGALTREDYAKFFKKFEGRHGAELAAVAANVKQANRKIATSPDQLIGDLVTTDAKGKQMLVDDTGTGAGAKAINDEMDKMYGNLSPHNLEARLNFQVQKNFFNEDGTPLSVDQTNSDVHRALRLQVAKHKGNLHSGAAFDLSTARPKLESFNDASFGQRADSELVGQRDETQLRTLRDQLAKGTGISMPMKPNKQFVEQAMTLLGAGNMTAMQKGMATQHGNLHKFLKDKGVTLDPLDTTKMGSFLTDSKGKSILDDAQRAAINSDPDLTEAYGQLQRLEHFKLNLEAMHAKAQQLNNAKTLKDFGVNAPRTT